MVVAIGVVNAFPGPAGAATNWAPARNVFSTNVSEISVDGTHRSRPAIEVRSDAAGNTIAAWIQKVGSDCQARWALRPAGGSWSTPHPLAMADCAISSAGSQVALAMNDAGAAVVAYTDGVGIVAAFRPAGKSFGTPTSMDAQAIDPTASINDHGKVAVGWVKPSFGFGSPTPFEARIRPAGGTFGAVETVTAPGSDTATSPRIAVGPAGDVLAAWVQNHPLDLSHSNLLFPTAYRPAAGHFPAAPTQTLDSFAARSGVGTTPDYAPDLAFDAAGQATVVWSHDTGSKVYLRSAAKLVGADTFQPGQDVNPSDEGNSFMPRIAVERSANRAIVVWQQCGTACTVRSAVRPDGGIYGSLETLSSPLPTNALQPAVGFTASGQAIAAWSGPVNGTGPDRVFAARRPKGGSFGAEEPISGPAGSDRDMGPALAFDGLGNAMAVWAHLTPTPSARLRYAEFLASYYQPDAMIKKAGGGAFVGAGIHNTSGLHQSVTANVRRGHSVTFDIRVVNPSSGSDRFTVEGPGAKSGFAVRYLAGTSGTTDITSAVVQGTYTLPKVLPGGGKTFRVVVTVKQGTAAGASNNWLVSATSTRDPSRKDVVNGIVQAVS
jgi:hypothetical protein